MKPLLRQITVLGLLLSMLLTPCLASAQCSASFIYGYLDEETVVFYNSSTNISNSVWDFGDGTTSPSDDQAVMIRAISNGGSTVCLSVSDDAGCEDQVCKLVTPDGPDEMCNITDCVWPGDVNSDGQANHFDLLYLGYGIGTNGTSRLFAPYPGNTLAWAPNYSTDWMEWLGDINFKHLDCNGNGIIGELDANSIIQNYSADLQFQSTSTAGAPKVYLEFAEDVIVIDDSSPDHILLQATLHIGSAGNPVTDLHGIAFDFTYPSDLVMPGMVNLNYDQNAFLGNDILSLGMDHSDMGRFDQTLSRKGGEGTTGFGEVATLTFIVSSDIIDGLAEPETPFNVILENVRMLDSGGNDLDFDLEPNGNMPIFINGGTAGIRPPLEDAVRVFPNPAQGLLYVELKDDYQGEQVSMYNSLGEKVLQQTLPQQLNKIELTDLPAGIYLLKVNTERGEISKRVVLE